MRKIRVIGIGAGNPDHVTVGAIRALNETDVFFLVNKTEATDTMRAWRVALCERFVEPSHPYRFVEMDDPERDRSSSAYTDAVDDWRRARVAGYAQLIADLGEEETGAFLVWGDPTLYDGTILMLDAILAQGDVAFSYEVVPGISSVSALAAAHRVPLNRAGETIQITTGRRLRRDGMPESAENVVVMLDAGEAWAEQAEDFEIFWGAFVGTPDEILIAGPVSQVGATIHGRRSQARTELGWMFDTYLLRRQPRA